MKVYHPIAAPVFSRLWHCHRHSVHDIVNPVPIRMKTSTQFFQGGFVGLLFFLLAGCSWNKPASESFASVLITNATADAIQKTTIKVFQENDYLSHYMDPDS